MSENGNLIKTFGLNSMRDINKYENIDVLEDVGVPIIKNSLGYMVCEIVEKYENDTHTLFIGKLIEADKFSDEEAMSYNYYQNHKDELVKVTTEDGRTAWVCTICGYVYYGDTLPDDFKCPKCGVDKSLFERK